MAKIFPANRAEFKMGGGRWSPLGGIQSARPPSVGARGRVGLKSQFCIPLYPPPLPHTPQSPPLTPGISFFLCSQIPITFRNLLFPPSGSPWRAYVRHLCPHTSKIEPFWGPGALPFHTFHETARLSRNHSFYYVESTFYPL